MSMPVETPAEVQIRPLLTKIASGLTVVAGWAAPSLSVYSQCVVASQPSSRPAAARMKAPRQIEPSRRVLPLCSRRKASREYKEK